MTANNKREMVALLSTWGKSNLASPYIRADFRRLALTTRTSLRKYATTVLRSKTAIRKEQLRDGAVRLLVALLPETFPEVELLLRKQAPRLACEAHFTTFCALDDRCPDLRAGDRKRVLALLENYLFRAQSHSGYAAWKAGDSLGDELFSSETLDILCRIAQCARHVEGRISALHGLEHTAGHLDRRSRRNIADLVAHIAVSDRSERVRSYAQSTLNGSGCGPKLTPRSAVRPSHRRKP